MGRKKWFSNTSICVSLLKVKILFQVIAHLFVLIVRVIIFECNSQAAVGQESF